MVVENFCAPLFYRLSHSLGDLYGNSLMMYRIERAFQVDQDNYERDTRRGILFIFAVLVTEQVLRAKGVL